MPTISSYDLVDVDVDVGLLVGSMGGWVVLMGKMMNVLYPPAVDPRTALASMFDASRIQRMR